MSAPYTFAVAASAEEAAAFAEATRADGRADADQLPATYTICWLALPAVRAILLAAVAEPGLVPVHESQSFDVEQPLRVAQPYRLRLAVRREADPARLVVDAGVFDADERACVRMETVLRLVTMRNAA